MNTCNDQIKALNNIQSSINSRDIQIYTNIAKADAIKKEIEKFNQEIQVFQKASEEWKLDSSRNEAQVQQLEDIINFFKKTSKVIIKSWRYSRSYNVLLKELNEKENEQFLSLYNSHEKEFNVHKNNYESTNVSFKKLNKSCIQLKKIKIICMMLKQQIDDTNETKRQYEEIQQRIFYNNIVRFAENCSQYYKVKEAFMVLTKLKVQEKTCAKKFLELQKKVKEQQKNRYTMGPPALPPRIPKINFEIDYVQMNEASNIISEVQKGILKSTKSKEKLSSIMNKLQNDSFEPNKENTGQNKITSSSINNSNVMRQKIFNESKSKVRIIDVKVLNPVIKKDSVPKESFYGKFRQIVQNAKNKIISRTPSQLSEHNFSSKTNNEKVDKSINKLQSLSQNSQCSVTEIESNIKNSQVCTEAKQDNDIIKTAKNGNNDKQTHSEENCPTNNTNLMLSQSKTLLMQDQSQTKTQITSNSQLRMKEEIFSQVSQNSVYADCENEKKTNMFKRNIDGNVSVPKINNDPPIKSCLNIPEKIDDVMKEKEKPSIKKTVSFHPFDLNICGLDNSEYEGIALSPSNTMGLNFSAQENSTEEQYETPFMQFGSSSHQGFSFEPKPTSQNNTESKGMFGFGGSFNMF